MDRDQAAFEFLKLQYEKAADRYNNIYQSIWTIFSYMSAVSAGLIAFGADRLSADGLGVLASLPLVFWFWSTYLPLDRYGNQTLFALRELEEAGKQHFQCQFQHFSSFAMREYGIFDRLRADCMLPVRDKTGEKKVNPVRKAVSRARFVICGFFIVLHVFLIAWFVGAWPNRFLREREEAPVRRIQLSADEDVLRRFLVQPAPESGPGVSTSTPPATSSREELRPSSNEPSGTRGVK